MSKVDGRQVGLRVRDLRQERGWTQGQLATVAGVTRSWLSLLEAGHTENPGIARLAAVARALRVSLHDLTGELRLSPGQESELLASAWQELRERYPGLEVSAAVRVLESWAGLRPWARERMLGWLEQLAQTPEARVQPTDTDEPPPQDAAEV